MGGEVAERAPKEGKKGLRRPKRRIAIRIDMTPMVDIAFLLLIFYMVTTVFAMPQAMEINLPPEVKDVEIAESNLLTIRVDGQGRYWWNMARVSPDNMPELLPPNPNRPDTVDYAFWPDTLRTLLVNKNQENNKLNTLIQINRDANYADMVNVLDEIDMIERSWNSFTAERLGVKVDEIPKDEKFSYRYAIGTWESRDDRIIEAAEAGLATQAASQGGE